MKLRSVLIFTVLNLAVIFSCAVCVYASDIRVGIFEFQFQAPEVDFSKASVFSARSMNKKYESGKKKYTQLFIETLSKAADFNAVKLKDPIMSLSSSSSEYRPIYRRDMTSNSSYGANNEFVAKYKSMLRSTALKEHCQYTVRGFLTFENTAKNEVRANVHLTITQMENDKNFYSLSSAKVPFSVSAPRKGKTKSAKDSSTNEQAARDQAAILAFNKAIQYFRYEITEDYPQIIDITGDTITINKGSSSFISTGDKFTVRAKVSNSDELDEIFGDTPKQASGMGNIAVITIKSVNNDSSTAEIFSNLGYISALRVNDNIYPANDMIVENFLSNTPKFPQTRPEPAKIAQQSVQPQKNISNSPAKVEAIPELPAGMLRVGVINFDSKVYGISEKGASTLTDLFSRMLSNSDKIAVLERSQLNAIAREHKLNLSGLVDSSTAAEIGKLASCQYILMGSVTGYEERDTVSGRYIRPTDSASFSQLYRPNMSSKAAGILLGLEIISKLAESSNAQKENVVTETHEVVTEIEARLVNVQTSQIISAFNERGNAAQSDIITQDGNGQIKNVEANYGDLGNRAIASTAANLSHRIREILADELVQIVSVNGNEIIINRGASSGIQTGDLFCVYSEGQSGGDTEAVISVTDVQEDFSTAEVAASIYDSYSPSTGSRLEPVLQSDFQRGIWHIKNQKRLQAQAREKDNLSFASLSSGKKRRLENASTDPKKVIKSYGLNSSQEKSLLALHTKAAKGSNTKKKYEAYKQISVSNISDYLAAYNTGRYALEQSMYIEAHEWASKALFANPNYKPAKDLIEKIDKGE